MSDDRETRLDYLKTKDTVGQMKEMWLTVVRLEGWIDWIECGNWSTCDRSEITGEWTLDMRMRMIRIERTQARLTPTPGGISQVM